jgi:hypothetical protein
MEVLGLPLIVLCLPLAFGLVPRNRFYGLRVPAALRSDPVWYAANSSAARQAVALGMLMVALEFMLPAATRISTLRWLAIVGLLLIVASNWRKANRLERNGSR